MWKICTEKIKKNMIKCTEKYVQYNQRVMGWAKNGLK